MSLKIEIKNAIESTADPVQWDDIAEAVSAEGEEIDRALQELQSERKVVYGVSPVTGYKLQ